MVYTIINTKIKRDSGHKEVTYTDYKHFDVNDFLADIQASLCFTIICHNVKNAFLSVCHKHAPVKTRRLKQRFCPWITADIVKLMYARDHAHKVAVREGDNRLWQQYRHLRKSHQQSGSPRKNTTKVNSSSVQTTLKRLTNKASNTNPPHNLTASVFNDHFCLGGELTAKSLGDMSSEAIWQNLRQVASSSRK